MRTRNFLSAALLAAAFAMAGNALAQAPAGGPPAGGPPRAQGGPGAPGAGAPGAAAARRPGLVQMYIESKAFPDGGIVPFKYANAGGSVQPDFKIIGGPPDAASYAIILHDIEVALGGPDDVLHWVAWNIPGNTTQIEEGKLPAGSVVGKNMRNNSYMGMGAPAGPRYHHYVFEFYALSSKLDLPETASRPELLAAMQGKVIAKAAYIGRFRTEPGMVPVGGAPGAGGPPAGGPPAPRPAQ
jgi:Raf kinase inhibitor-like YbhB/YbcL family protein